MGAVSSWIQLAQPHLGQALAGVQRRAPRLGGGALGHGQREALARGVVLLLPGGERLLQVIGGRLFFVTMKSFFRWFVWSCGCV